LKDKKKYIIPIVLIMCLVVVCILGHFLFDNRTNNKIEHVVATKSVYVEKTPLPVIYRHITTEIAGNRQEINVLEIDLSAGNTKITPALSHDRLFGFEELSSIFARSNAYAAINAGFFYEYGDPSGMVVIDGRIITKSSGEFPVFVVKEQQARLAQIKNEIYMLHSGKRIDVSKVNRMAISGNVILYTTDFGTDNRAEISNTSIVIKNNKVQKVLKTKTSTNIPKDGMVLTFYEPYKYDFDLSFIKQGDDIKMVCKPEITPDMQAYECGSWIVKDGKNVALTRDVWVGLLTNRDPRTVVGIKPDGTVVLMTIDGRQPAYSVGVSSKELADYIIKYGVQDAAMLDGGASTEMIVKGKIVNKPSFKGRERPLGGALLIELVE